MTDTRLKAALYLEAVLPALPLLAAHDEPLAAALAGPDVSIALSTPGGLCARLAIRNGQATITHTPSPGDLRLWFPSAGQLVRAFDASGRTALALPIGGWHQLPHARRLSAAGERLETILNSRSPEHLRLHIWGNLVVGVAAAASWLRHHPEGSSLRARFSSGTGVLSCPDFPEPIWFDTTALTWGLGDLVITGLQPLAEQLGLIMLKAGKLLKPVATA